MLRPRRLGNWHRRGKGVAIRGLSKLPASSVYDKRKVRIKDEPIRGKAVRLTVLKRRFTCANKQCRRIFTEPVAGISKGGRTTRRLKRAIAWACKTFSSLKEVSKQYRASARLVYSAFYSQLDDWAKARAHDLPKKIGLDEHSIRKPKYRATEFATIVVDHKKEKVFDLIDGNSREKVCEALRKMNGRENVQWVSMDLSNTYRSVTFELFPNAKIVADRFHVERLFTRRVNKLRKKITGDDRKNPINKLLLRPGYKLNFFERAAVTSWLNFHPELREMWELKEAVSRFYRTKGFNKARHAFVHILDRMGRSKSKLVLALRKTILSWKNEILNYHVERLSNGRVEGFNRVGKLIQRMGYGYRNFNNYRLRLLNACFFRSKRKDPPRMK